MSSYHYTLPYTLVWVDWLRYITFNYISDIYVTTHGCAIIHVNNGKIYHLEARRT